MRREIGEATARSLFEEQRDYANKALALDPGLAPALLAYRGLQPPCGAFTERERIFRAATSYGRPMPPLPLLHLRRASARSLDLGASTKSFRILN